MPMVSATRRASYTSSIEQQRPWTDSGMPSCPARRRWFQSCMVRPMTLWPSARSMAATAEESTPPDMATAMVDEGILSIVNRMGVVGEDRSGIVRGWQLVDDVSDHSIAPARCRRSSVNLTLTRCERRAYGFRAELEIGNSGQEKFLAYGSPNLVPKLWHTRPPLCKIVRRRWMALSPGRYSRLLKLSEQTRRDQNETYFLCRYAHDDRYRVAIHWQRGRADLQQDSKPLVGSSPSHRDLYLHLR